MTADSNKMPCNLKLFIPKGLMLLERKKLVQLFHKSVGVKRVCGKFSTLTFGTGYLRNPQWCPTASTVKEGTTVEIRIHKNGRATPS